MKVSHAALRVQAVSSSVLTTRVRIPPAVRTGNIWNFANRDDMATVRRLLSEGVPSDLTNKVGWTPLHAAAFGGAERVVAHLLQHERVASDPTCRAGRTPLMDAARSGHLGCVKALVKAGASVAKEDNGGLRALEYAKGEAVRAWLASRTPGAERDEAKTPRGGGKTPRGGGGGGISHGEKVAERQKIGASGKQKAALLKQRRSETQAAKAAAQLEAPAHSRADGRSEARAAAAAKTEKDSVGVSTSGGKANEAQTAVDAITTLPEPTGPPDFGAGIDERRRYAYAPLEPRRAKAVGATPFCLELGGLGTSALDYAESLVSSTGTRAEAGRQIACIVADARHPLVYAPACLYARLLAVQPTPPEIVICLTKCDLVSPDGLKAWVTALRARYAAARVVAFSSKGKGIGENGIAAAGVASRRRQIQAPLSAEERLKMRAYAEEFAAASRIHLPAWARSMSKVDRFGASDEEEGEEDLLGTSARGTRAMRAARRRKGRRKGASAARKSEASSDSEGSDDSSGDEGREEEEGEEEEEDETSADHGDSSHKGLVPVPAAASSSEDEEEDEDEDDDEDMLLRLASATKMRSSGVTKAKSPAARAPTPPCDDDDASSGGDEGEEDDELLEEDAAVKAKEDDLSPRQVGDEVLCELGGDAFSGSERQVVITLLGLPNAGRSSLANSLTCSRLASVSRTPGSTKRVQRMTLAPGVVLRDTPPLPLLSTSERDAPFSGVSIIGGGAARGHIYELLGVLQVANVREAYSAVRELYMEQVSGRSRAHLPSSRPVSHALSRTCARHESCSCTVRRAAALVAFATRVHPPPDMSLPYPLRLLTCPCPTPSTHPHRTWHGSTTFARPN